MPTPDRLRVVNQQTALHNHEHVSRTGDGAVDQVGSLEPTSRATYTPPSPQCLKFRGMLDALHAVHSNQIQELISQVHHLQEKVRAGNNLKNEELPPEGSHENGVQKRSVHFVEAQSAPCALGVECSSQGAGSSSGPLHDASLLSFMPDKGRRSESSSRHSSPPHRQTTRTDHTGHKSAATSQLHRSTTAQEELDKKTTAVTKYASGTAHIVRDRKMAEFNQQMSNTFVRARMKLQSVVDSMVFQSFFAAVIITNSFFLGLRTDLDMKRSGDNEPKVFLVVEYIFTVLFTSELVVRVIAEGIGVFCSADKFHWYYLDLFVVATSLFEMGLEIAQSSSGGSMNFSNSRMFRVIRIVRLVKIVRIARVVRFVRALRTLVLSIVHTLRSVLWAFMLLLLIIYVFGLVFVQNINHFLKENKERDNSALELWWGSLPRSMFTLYKSISGGISWDEVIKPLVTVDESLVLIFVVFISFTLFAVLNVITGVFCEAAIEGARQDYEMVVQQHLAEKKKFTQAMYEVFEVDPDKRDSEALVLTYGEFEEVLTDDKTRAYLSAVQLDIQDAWELFKLLDTDESALIDVEEFINGCLRLKGMAKAIDLAKMDYENKVRYKRLMRSVDSLERQLGSVAVYFNVPLDSESEPHRPSITSSTASCRHSGESRRHSGGGSGNNQKTNNQLNKSGTVGTASTTTANPRISIRGQEIFVQS